MNPLTDFILTYLLNSLWQVPLIFAAAWLAVRATRGLGTAMEHRIWVSSLVLEVVLPACSVNLADQFHNAWQLLLRSFGLNAPALGTSVITVTGAGYAHAVLRLQPVFLIGIAVAYVCSIAYFALRLAGGFWKSAALRRLAQPVTLTNATTVTWQRCRDLFGVHEAQIAVSTGISGPATIGIRRRVLLLPEGWLATLAEEDLGAAIAHELAHMRRRDFAINLLYEVLSLPVAYHPLLWLTRSGIAESREILCDEMAAEAVAGKQKYVRSLLRLASMLTDRTQANALHAIGIFDANNFERRVMKLTKSTREIHGIKRLAITAVCVVLGLGTCASALAFRLEVSAPALQPESQSTPAESVPIRVRGAAIAGNILTKVVPVYPPDAKTAKIQGSVVLRAIIGKDGNVEHLQVVSGPAELQASALDAVHQWTYKPYLLNGNPTEVETTITVNYSLQK